MQQVQFTTLIAITWPGTVASGFVTVYALEAYEVEGAPMWKRYRIDAAALATRGMLVAKQGGVPTGNVD